MEYYEVKIKCPQGETEEAENILIINDITDYFVSDPKMEMDILTQMNWLIKDELSEGDAVITVCTETKEQAEEIANILKDKYPVTVENASDSEWIDNWKQFAHEVHIDDTLVIQPAWVEYEKNENENIILLDSGAAFGTGTHETTKQCAKMLKKYIKKDDLMLDIGTGSGILAAIGGICGAKKIIATDIDSVAVETAKINLKTNNCENICDVRCGNLLECIDIENERFDIITANIIVDVLLDLFSNVKKVMKEDGILIMSGILEERFDEILKKAKENGFKQMDKTTENDWCCVAFKKEI